MNTLGDYECPSVLELHFLWQINREKISLKFEYVMRHDAGNSVLV